MTTAPSGKAGIVYDACQVSLNRQVALKVISGSLGLSIAILSFLFGGGPPPAAPGPTTEPCGPDPDEEGSPGDLDCNEATDVALLSRFQFW